jgi:hypothetical protein
MSCLSNIIGVKEPCSNTLPTTLSGYYITDYPGISLQSASNVADEKTITGYEYLKDLVRRAMMRLNNDLLSYINNEYIVNTVKKSIWKSGNYNQPLSTIASGSASEQRGLYFQKKHIMCDLYKLFIPRVRILANYTGDSVLTINDVNAGIAYPIPIALVAGIEQEYEIELAIRGDEVRVTLPSNISVYSNKPMCGIGCGNTAISDAVIVYGINNGTIDKLEAYGIEVDILVKCDLSRLVCDMASDNMIGQAAYELAGAMFYDEMTKSNRMNYLTIFKGEELKQQASAGFESYRNYMANAFAGLRNYLVSKDGGCKCIDCGGVQIKSNV